jgi:hypothetical protein
LAGDVGSLRGTTQNLAAGVGTALAGALLVGLLSASVMTSLASRPSLPPAIEGLVNLDNVNFVSNERLRTVLTERGAAPALVEDAVEVNSEARLRALKIGLLIMACIALLAILPASRLPPYTPGNIPANPPPPDAATQRRLAHERLD